MQEQLATDPSAKSKLQRLMRYVTAVTRVQLRAIDVQEVKNDDPVSWVPGVGSVGRERWGREICQSAGCLLVGESDNPCQSPFQRESLLPNVGSQTERFAKHNRTVSPTFLIRVPGVAWGRSVGVALGTLLARGGVALGTLLAC